MLSGARRSIAAPSLVFALFLALGPAAAWAQPLEEDSPPEESGRPFYVVEEQPAVFAGSDSTRVIGRLAYRDEVTVTAVEGTRFRVRTPAGGTGYVERDALSNVWVRVSKRNGKVYVYRGAELLHAFRADFGYNREDDKVRRGSPEEPDHWRTPEGRFLITDKNEDSRFYRALVLNYPTAEDAERGLRQGLIDESQHAKIVEASVRHESPPMNTRLGGWIEIHGDGTGGKIDWTEGCIALQNAHLDTVWGLVSEGTPVVIE